MKRQLSSTPNTISLKTPRTEWSNEERFFTELVNLEDAPPVEADLDLDALLRHLLQQDIPPGPTVLFDQTQTSVVSSAWASSSSGILAGSWPSFPPPNSSVDNSLPARAELGMEELLVCRPVAATLLGFLPLDDWFALRGVARYWRDAVDQQLKSLKRLNVKDILVQRGWPCEELNMKNAQAFFGFMSEKAPVIQSLVTGSWINAFPQALNRFEKLKHLDMEGAITNSELFKVLENLTTLESLEAISLPSVFLFPEESFRKRLQVLIGRLHSLQSLKFISNDQHNHYPTLLEDLKNPEKLTSLFIEDSNFCSLLPELQSLLRFNNLENLEMVRGIGRGHRTPTETNALDSALNQLKALKRLVLGDWGLSVACVQRLTELPHLERLTVTSVSLPEGVHWSQFKQLTCLELGAVQESFIDCINQITSLNCLKLSAAGKVKFVCSLPQLHTLCLDSVEYTVLYSYRSGSFWLDFQPVCCNLKNLTLLTDHDKLHCLSQGLLKYNAGIRNLSIGWDFDGRKTVLLKAKSVANSCKSLETLELNGWESSEDLSQAVSLFVGRCPLLKNLKTEEVVDDVVEAKFGHLINISEFSSKKDSWLFN